MQGLNKTYTVITAVSLEKLRQKGVEALYLGDTICRDCAAKIHNAKYCFVKPTASGSTESSTASSNVDVSDNN